MNNNKIVYIPSVDAKDIYLANNFLDEEKSRYGYRIKKVNGEINYNKFVNTFDNSLDLIHLREVAAMQLPKKDSLTFYNKGKEYSNKIINVTFKYSNKTFNKYGTDTYVKFGYDSHGLQYSDCISKNGDEIIGVITNTPVVRPISELPDGFEYSHDKNGNTVYVCKNLKVLNSVRDLREIIYKRGFFLEGRHYIRFKRSSGSARVGKCLFIDERLYKQMHKWEMCGVHVANGDKVDLASLEAYISLPTSSIIDTLEIQPENILVIDDYDSTFKESCIVVEANVNNSLVASERETEIKNSIFDGQSLIDVSLMGDYAIYGMVLLRNRFFKSCCFNTNIQQWFSDNGITSLGQLNGFTLAQDIRDVKLITTPSSIKYVKFGKLIDWLREIDSTFGVVKHEKKTHFFGGRMFQAHYQLLNTLQLSPGDIDNLLQPSFDYMDALNTDVDVLRYHIKCSVQDEYDENLTNVMKSKNEIVYKMLSISDKFKDTKILYDFKRDLLRAYANNMKKGHILIEGNYSTLLGNPYEMLLHSIGKFDGITSLPPGHVHTSRYSYGKTLLGVRSPHISTSNILITENMEHPLIDKYFNLTDEIVCINAIEENILERLSGADYDSDQIGLTDNKILVSAAQKNYDIWKVPANHVEAKKIKRCYCAEEKADLDFKTAENKIGEIVNMSQELNTRMWDIVNNSGESMKDCYEDIKEIYHDICILNVMSCIEIDKAKKEFDVKNSKELRRLKEKYTERDDCDRTIKPAFLGFIAKTKGYYEPGKKCYQKYDTAMDYLVAKINSRKSQKDKASNFIPLSECFNLKNNIQPKSEQVKKILGLCVDTSRYIQYIWMSAHYDNSEKVILSNRAKYELCLLVNDIRMNVGTVSHLIKCIDSPKYKSICKVLFHILFQYQSISITDFIRSNEFPMTYISENVDGDIVLYGRKYKRYTQKKVMGIC